MLGGEGIFHGERKRHAQNKEVVKRGLTGVSEQDSEKNVDSKFRLRPPDSQCCMTG